MINDIKTDAQTRMGKSIDSLKHDLTPHPHRPRQHSAGGQHRGALLRLGHAAEPGRLGVDWPMLARSSSRRSKKPWSAPIEKALMASDLGITPTTAGTVIRLNMPPLDRRAPQASWPSSVGQRRRERQDRDPQRPPRRPAADQAAQGQGDHRGRRARATTTSRSSPTVFVKEVDAVVEAQGRGADGALTSHRTQPSHARPAPGSAPFAIVMDGNGRWAKARGRPRSFGHNAGRKAVREAVEGCLRRGIERSRCSRSPARRRKRMTLDPSRGSLRRLPHGLAAGICKAGGRRRALAQRPLPSITGDDDMA